MQFNYLHLFLDSNIVVQIVIVLLIYYSFSSWSIIIEKFLILSPQMKKLKKFESFYIKNRGTNEQTMKNLVSVGDNYANLITYNSFRKMRDFVITHNDQEYSVDELRNLAEQNFNVKMKVLENKLDKLGTIATATPFIGLVGTVFGIINSFQSIGETKSISLTVIAPGIAEALFTTALGFVVAIPAMIFYNKFINHIDRIYNSSESFFNDVSVIIANILSKKK
jgi:biopolymer transport protein TolQ